MCACGEELGEGGLGPALPGLCMTQKATRHTAMVHTVRRTWKASHSHMEGSSAYSGALEWPQARHGHIVCRSPGRHECVHAGEQSIKVSIKVSSKGAEVLRPPWRHVYAWHVGDNNAPVEKMLCICSMSCMVSGMVAPSVSGRVKINRPARIYTWHGDTKGHA